MPLLFISQLTCFEKEDSGADEATLQINGNTAFGPRSMVNGQSESFLVFHRYTGTVTVNLIDEEVGTDDFLGTVAIPETSPIGVLQIGLFDAAQPAALYHMSYQILP